MMMNLVVVVVLAVVLLQVSSLKVSALKGSRLTAVTHSKLHLAASVDTSSEYNAIKQLAAGALHQKVAEGKAPAAFVTMLVSFLDEYAESNLAAKTSPEKFKNNVFTLLKTVQEALVNPYQFKPFHQAVREPFDFYSWGNEFLKPLIIDEQSKAFGLENAKRIEEYISKGENVIILSNHQTEVDPQVLSILLEKNGMASLAEKVVFIAGHKVTNDPIAIPFSMGRNLICIHSKKHIKNPPEDIPRKQAQNLDSMKAMSDLITEGGKIFWVAPSGGRDRPNDAGDFVVAPFDFKALDMFKLLAYQTKKPMHFFPMAMYTNKLVPPPETVSSTLGETRSAKRGPVSINFLDETADLGGLKDKEFCETLQRRVEVAFGDLVKFHASF